MAYIEHRDQPETIQTPPSPIPTAASADVRASDSTNQEGVGLQLSVLATPLNVGYLYDFPLAI